MFGLGGWELAVIVLLGLIFFGPNKLPQLMRQLGKVMREVKKASDEFQFSINRELDDDEYRRAHRRAKKKAQKLAERKKAEGAGGAVAADGGTTPAPANGVPAQPAEPKPEANGNGGVTPEPAAAGAAATKSSE